MIARTAVWGVVLLLVGVCAKAELEAAEARAPKVEARAAQRLGGKYSGFEPAVAADNDGHIVVTAMDGFTQRAVVWTSADAGKTFSSPHFPLPPPDERTRQGDLTVQSAGRGVFFLSLMATRAPAEPGMFAYLLRSDDSGRTWKAARQLSAPRWDVDRPILAVSPNGRRAAVVFHGGGGPGTLQVLFSSDGATTWTAAPVLLVGPKIGANPYSIVIDDQGRTIVGYESIRNQSYWLELGITEDGGKTWRHHDFGRLGAKIVEMDPQEEAAGVFGMFSGVALAQDGTATLHAMFARRGASGNQADVWYRRSTDAKAWSEPVRISSGRAPIKVFPALAASGTRVHAIWLECDDGWCRVCYRGSADSGKTWSELVTLSKPEQATSLVTQKGFRAFAGHYMGIAEDGRGTAHAVWAVSGGRGESAQPGEVWHASVQLGKD
jgi:hypothetical protein